MPVGWVCNPPEPMIVRLLAWPTLTFARDLKKGARKIKTLKSREVTSASLRKMILILNRKNMNLWSRDRPGDFSQGLGTWVDVPTATRMLDKLWQMTLESGKVEVVPRERDCLTCCYAPARVASQERHEVTPAFTLLGCCESIAIRIDICDVWDRWDSLMYFRGPKSGNTATRSRTIDSWDTWNR